MKSKHRGDFSIDNRLLLLLVAAIPTGILASFSAVILLYLINFFTNIFFFHQFSFAAANPSEATPSLLTFLAPCVGGLIIGLMARFGSERIRGHGIPEALEAILFGKSIMNPRVAVLKPLSSAISLGSGGPFGAEGPIIMTGGALGSICAQFFRFSASERKTLLVAGAAAGMSAIFASPIAAVLLAVELLLFEWKPRSLIPVAVASSVAAAMRHYMLGAGPIIPLAAMPILPESDVLCAILVGVVAGGAAALLSSSLYKLEDFFHRLPLHWMWWPCIGGLAVGLGGLIEPRALGIGFDVITDFLNGRIGPSHAGIIITVKALIWVIALASGTSGGVLAPLLMIGAGLGLVEAQILPGDPALWAMVSMSAMLGGVMGVPFTAMIFAVELTHVTSVLPLLLAACIASYTVSVFITKRSILTEKIARRGFDIFREYNVDPLERMRVIEVMSKEITMHDADPIPSSIHAHASCRKAAEMMARESCSILRVLDDHSHQAIGYVNLVDLLKARKLHIDEEELREKILFK